MIRETFSSQQVTVSQQYGLDGPQKDYQATLYTGKLVDGIQVDILDIPAYTDSLLHPGPRRRVFLVRDATDAEQKRHPRHCFSLLAPDVPERQIARVLWPIWWKIEKLDPLFLVECGLLHFEEHSDLLQKDIIR